jgi:uncharacterized protein (TIGR02300 family)
LGVRRISKPELGQKMTCSACAARFFDLCRVPAICPKCGVEQRAARAASPYSTRIAPKRWLPRASPTMAVESEPEQADPENAELTSDGDSVSDDEVTVEEVDEVG